MIVVMKPGAGPEQIAAAAGLMEAGGVRVSVSHGAENTVLGAEGPVGGIDRNRLSQLPGVDRIIPISEPFRMVSRRHHQEDTVVSLPGGAAVGGNRLAVFAGPCSVESREQICSIAQSVQASGACALRGGAFKPRTSPYDFQGIGAEGVRLLAEARKESGLPVVSELLSVEDLELFAEQVDVIQIGARSMQNFDLLKHVGRLRKPVLLKRGMSATIEDWLMSAEYIMAGGNEQIILCERGIRTFETYTRNTLDLSAVPAVKELSHLPVLVDPSHGCGQARLVEQMSLAAVAAGADGLLIEVHNDPANALSDGRQSITPAQFSALMERLKPLAACLGRSL